ncbi:MAG: hypothetical protein HFI88_10220 [Lachnospiraceae bacterium]|nr:hypothetical protein [Lachnospiraceae bacterium]
MLEQIKARCGIAVDIYDGEIKGYIEDCLQDMGASGVPGRLLNGANAQVLTAVTLYVKAYLGNDRSDTGKYLDLYRKKVFRLTLEDDDVEQEH